MSWPYSSSWSSSCPSDSRWDLAWHPLFWPMVAWCSCHQSAAICCWFSRSAWAALCHSWEAAVACLWHVSGPTSSWKVGIYKYSWCLSIFCLHHFQSTCGGLGRRSWSSTDRMYWQIRRGSWSCCVTELFLRCKSCYRADTWNPCTRWAKFGA